MPAMSGASSITRVSLTTIAVASATATGGRRCRDDLRDVVDARADPGAELLVVEPERVAQRRQRHDRERAAERHERDRERDLVLVGVDHAVRGRDRGDAADREARRDEQREVVRDAEPAAGPARPEERDRDDRDDDDERLEAEREDVGEDEIEAEQDDAELQHRPRGEPEAGSGCRRHAQRRSRRRCRVRRRGRAGAARGSAQWAPSETATPAPASARPGSAPHHSSGCRNG